MYIGYFKRNGGISRKFPLSFITQTKAVPSIFVTRQGTVELIRFPLHLQTWHHPVNYDIICCYKAYRGDGVCMIPVVSVFPIFLGSSGSHLTFDLL